MTSSGELLGTYPIEEVGVARVGSDRFDLQVGSERLVFTADDSLRFSYEALPLIESARRRPQVTASRFRSWLKRRLPVVVEAEAPDREATPPAQEPKAPTPVARAFTPTRESPSLSEMRADLQRRTSEVVSAGTENPAMVGSEEVPVARSMSSDPVHEQAPPPGAPVGSCIGIRSDGKICGSAAVSERGFCFAHDPDRHVERREVMDKTTRAADRVRRSALENLDDVVSRLERAVAEVHEGRLDPQQALAMASLAQAMVETIELAKSDEAGRNRT
ncbi:MAG TPA: hypothetical protein VLB67_04960 [Acidimicrobiia bacterium]|nr:hypothetical protein [Acidimicrobiia bacterium]